MKKSNHHENQSQDVFENENTAPDLPKNKLIKSRNAWRQRAQELAKTCKSLQEQVRNLSESRDTWKAKALERKDFGSKEIESLNKEIRELQAKLLQVNSILENQKKKPK